MSPIEFKSEEASHVIYQCSSCSRIYTSVKGDEESKARSHIQAEVCCGPSPCKECHAPARKGYLLCEGCLRDKERMRLARIFENAEKHPHYQGPVYDPYSERFFSDMDCMLDDYENSGEPLPPYVHVCSMETPKLDLRTIIDNAEDVLELEHGFEVDWVGEAELASAIDEFNKKQTTNLWYPDMNKVVAVER